MIFAVAALGLVVAFLTFLVVGLLRSHAEILRSLSSEPAADAEAAPAEPSPYSWRKPEDRVATELAPVQPTAAVQEAAVHEVRGETLEFEPASIALSTEKPTLLAFLSSGCLTCSEFFSSFSDRPAMNEALRDIELVIVPKSRNEENVKKLREMAPASFPTVMSSETWARLQVPGSPYFVLIDSDHQFLGAGSANTWSQVHSLVADSLDERRIIEGKASRAGSRFSREDADLAAAGITPDHPSLYRGIWGEGDDR